MDPSSMGKIICATCALLQRKTLARKHADSNHCVFKGSTILDFSPRPPQTTLYASLQARLITPDLHALFY